MSHVIRRVVDEIEHTRRNRAGKSRVDDREEAERETPSVGIFDYNDEFVTYSLNRNQCIISVIHRFAVLFITVIIIEYSLFLSDFD